jgi:hypothetical protein
LRFEASPGKQFPRSYLEKTHHKKEEEEKKDWQRGSMNRL